MLTTLLSWHLEEEGSRKNLEAFHRNRRICDRLRDPPLIGVHPPSSSTAGSTKNGPVLEPSPCAPILVSVAVGGSIRCLDSRRRSRTPSCAATSLRPSLRAGGDGDGRLDDEWDVAAPLALGAQMI